MKDRLAVVKLDPLQPQLLAEFLRSTLVAKGMRSGSPRYRPLENIIEHVTQLKAQCLILQRNVQDPDFFAEHSAYYSKWSIDVPRDCHRLHFFGVVPVSENPLEVIDQMANVEGSYLGFVTLRPISMSPAAATILRPLREPRHHFILAKDEFRVNLAGQKFSVCGTPFMQQDNAVGACAQASIWMALRTLRRKEGQAAFSPAQITNAATRFLVRGRTLPNRSGLSFEQITEALRAAGYAPHAIPLRDFNKSADSQSLRQAKQALYPYVESGIPVLVLLSPPESEGHVVLLIGHGWKPEPSPLIECGQINDPTWANPIAIYDAASWVEPFYIHNDNTGPYLNFPETSQDTYSLSDAVIALPFLQTDVFVDGSEAQLTSLRLLAESLEDLPRLTSATAGTEKRQMPNLVARTYLQERSEFRHVVLGSTLPDDVKKYYRLKWLPRRVWVTELNACDGYGQCPEGSAVRLGEILLDPASEPEDGAFLTIHLSGNLLPSNSGLGGVIIDRDGHAGDIHAFPVSGGAYPPFVRPPG